MTRLTGPTVVREVVEQKLRRLDGDAVLDQQGDFVVRRGGHTAWVRVVGVQSDLTIVVVFGVVAAELEQVDEACRFLAAECLELPFCHFELHGDGRILVASHSLLGEFLSGEELRAAIDAVTHAVAVYGPKVHERFGGSGGAAATPPTFQLAENRRMMTALADQEQQRRRLEASSQRSRLVGTSIALGVAAALLGGTWSWWGAGFALAATLLIAYIVGTAMADSSRKATLAAVLMLAALGVAVAGASGGKTGTMLLAAALGLLFGSLLGALLVAPAMRSRRAKDAGRSR